MNRTPRSNRFSTFLVGIFALSVCGCTTGYDLLDTGMGSIEMAAAGDRYAAITETNLYQDGGYLVITGLVEEKPMATPPTAYNPHVDVAVFSPDGTLSLKRSVAITLQESLESEFKIRLPYLAERGARVRFAYHGNRQLAEESVNCPENAAALSAGA